MPNEPMDQKPGLWTAIAVLCFVAGAGLVFWREMTRSAGEGGGVSILVGGGLVGFSVWAWARSRMLAKSRDGEPTG